MISWKKPRENLAQSSFCYIVCFSKLWIKFQHRKLALNLSEYRQTLYCNTIWECSWELNVGLTHFIPVSHVYTPWKRQKTFGFLTFSEGIEMEYRPKMDQISVLLETDTLLDTGSQCQTLRWNTTWNFSETHWIYKIETYFSELWLLHIIYL